MIDFEEELRSFIPSKEILDALSSEEERDTADALREANSPEKHRAESGKPVKEDRNSGW